MLNQSKLVSALHMAGISLKQGEPMMRHTSFRIGGPAAVMAFPESPEQLCAVLDIARQLSVRPILLGAGSNVLAPDEGLETLVVETRTGMTGIRLGEVGQIIADCGVTLARLAVFAQEHALAGLAFAHGIPGTVGGGVFMNAGAYGGEIAQVLSAVTVRKEDGSVVRLDAEELDLSYRHSVLMEQNMIVLTAEFRLQPGDSDAIQAEMTDLMGRRKASQPLEYPSAGSTFKRPKGGYAAAMIDHAGLRGYGVGGAKVSEKHAGFVINAGGATCRDVLAVMEGVQKKVLEDTGTLLEPEVRILGR